MDCTQVGALIYQLRTERRLTQKDIATALHISDKTVSKWECGMGCTDISLLPDLEHFLQVPMEALLQGALLEQETLEGNMKKIQFYVCPICGNIATATGTASLACCGRTLSALQAQVPQQAHGITVENIENDLYLTLQHPMHKEHFISFVAYVHMDRLLLMKLYPEQDAHVRFPAARRGKLYWYCTQHGFFAQDNNVR